MRLLTLIALLAVYGCAGEIPPLPEVTASSDPVVIERGRYLVYGPAGCARCHTDRSLLAQLQAGEELPLTGGRTWESGLGTVYAANITPDKATGIGRWSDGEIARAIRHAVDRDGRVMAPMMEYADITDDDLRAMVSFLRNLDPVAKRVPDTDWSVVGRIAQSLVLKPKMPSGHVYGERAATVEYGAYLANVLSACVACHTERDQSTGNFVGAPLAGGTRFVYEEDLSKVVLVPNITPDMATGRVASMTEEQFLLRMRAGPSVQMTHMPWGGFKRTDDQDLRAIYRYLMSVEPVVNNTGPVLQSAQGEG